MASILQKQGRWEACWRNVTSGQWVSSACVQIPASIYLKGILKPESEHAN